MCWCSDTVNQQLACLHLVDGTRQDLRIIQRAGQADVNSPETKPKRIRSQSPSASHLPRHRPLFEFIRKWDRGDPQTERQEPTRRRARVSSSPSTHRFISESPRAREPPLSESPQREREASTAPGDPPPAGTRTRTECAAGSLHHLLLVRTLFCLSLLPPPAFYLGIGSRVLFSHKSASLFPTTGLRGLHCSWLIHISRLSRGTLSKQASIKQHTRGDKTGHVAGPGTGTARGTGTVVRCHGQAGPLFRLLLVVLGLLIRLYDQDDRRRSTSFHQSGWNRNRDRGQARPFAGAAREQAARQAWCRPCRSKGWSDERQRQRRLCSPLLLHYSSISRRRRRRSRRSRLEGPTGPGWQADRQGGAAARGRRTRTLFRCCCCSACYYYYSYHSSRGPSRHCTAHH